MASGLLLLTVLGGVARAGGRPATAALVVGDDTLPVVSGSRLFVPVKEGEEKSFGLCLVGNTSSCPGADLGTFEPRDGRCAMRTTGCRCWQWVSTAEWLGDGDEAGARVRRSSERPDCLVISLEGEARQRSREISIRTRLLRNKDRFLSRGGKFALEEIHRSVWGHDIENAGTIPVSSLSFVSFHAEQWCEHSESSFSAFSCEDEDAFYLRIDSRPPRVVSRERALFYYGWPLGVLVGMLGVVFFAERLY